MDIFESLGIRKYINAHDTYTVYGGSRMSPETLNAIQEISRAFVDMDELLYAAGKRVAELTHNEAAFITNGAAGAIQLASAVCMCQGDPYRYMRLPEADGFSNEFVVLRCQHNAYDKAIEGAGGHILEIGDADETLPFELEGVLKKGVAGVFFFPSSLYQRGALPLEHVIRLAHQYGTPVIVDAAAQLPPRENLWLYTSMGADMVIFSGGKTLCGPQNSGIILGPERWIADCRRFGAPAHGICRSSKPSRESVAGLVAALEQYMSLDPAREAEHLSGLNRLMADILSASDRCLCRVVPFGPVGQTYPRLFIDLKGKKTAPEITEMMRKRGIYIGCDGKQTVYISPLNLTQAEAKTVAESLLELITEE